MTIEEAMKVINDFRKKGISDERLLYSQMMMYINDEINFDEFISLSYHMGYTYHEKLFKLTDKERKQKKNQKYFNPIKIDDFKDISTFTCNLK